VDPWTTLSWFGTLSRTKDLSDLSVIKGKSTVLQYPLQVKPSFLVLRIAPSEFGTTQWKDIRKSSSLSIASLSEVWHSTKTDLYFFPAPTTRS
jgi:hypothetical protein